ncbi:cell division protein ZapB [Colwellia sp. D2M02]|uniref:cell division protein ZapB n=1 Tax=Colwellia sp. D2M02 TaxID=2841562 RepID=UPI001C089139|nr:cell division protein ZapB [Colwellia sp. D2M02]MBU2893650.1 cell division protein ZapB [Colwellia sp. D2M02]
MLENTLPQLEQLIEAMIEKNASLKAEISNLQQQNASLADENEMLQLELLEGEEKQKQARSAVENLLGKLQSVQEPS